MTGIFMGIMDWLASLGNVALAILPNSPIQAGIATQGFQGFQTIMGNINYFVPIGTFITILTSYATAVLIYYGLRVILRWAKAIQ